MQFKQNNSSHIEVEKHDRNWKTHITKTKTQKNY